MSKVKRKVVLVVVGLALALMLGAASNGIEFGTSGDQASDFASTEMMQLAAEHEDSTGGG
ncbi:MAG: hypothetical protein AAF702_25335 [Chloroflexota bacterium]